MDTSYFKKYDWLEDTFSKRGKLVLTLLLAIVVIGFVVAGCGVVQNMNSDNNAQQPVEQPVAEKAGGTAEIEIEATPAATPAPKIDVEAETLSRMVTYDISSVGRADPFMPSDEIAAFDKARADAIAEANAYNSRLYAKNAEIAKLKGMVIREPDDISPYSFNLPVPPTSLASSESAAAKITRTKVVGIMYNPNNPSAIINVDDKDYLVRQGDKIMDQEYKVLKINQSWITVGLGSNIYSASIGELFSKDELDGTRNDLYNLKNRFGGRKS